MMFTWVQEFTWDFPKDELLRSAESFLKSYGKPIDSMELAYCAVKKYLPCMDDEYYYSIRQNPSAISHIYNNFFNECNKELDELIKKAGLEQY